VVTNGVGALTAAVLGTGTIALLLKSALVRGLLYHGQQLSASAVYGRELYASDNAAFYAVICVAFPVIGAILGALGSAAASPTADRGQTLAVAPLRNDGPGDR
jgi:hypothetical protein